MPWTIRPGPIGSWDCSECGGTPPDSGNGTGQCPACGTVMLSQDPGPGEAFRITLTLTHDPNGRRLPRRERRFIQIDWGERHQADGTVAKVYRLIDQRNDRYVEKVTLTDNTIIECDEPLSQHRAHGSASPNGALARRGSQRRRWVDF
jgi:hypothetical protein